VSPDPTSTPEPPDPTPTPEPSPSPSPSPSPTPEPGIIPADAKPVFSDNFEGALSKWQLLTEQGAAPAVTTPGNGARVASVTVDPGEKRSEMQPSGVRVQPGMTAWFRDRIQLAPGFPTTVQPGINGFQVVMQWKDLGGTRSSSPPLELGVQKGQFDVLGGYGCPSGSRKFVLPIGAATTGVWHEFVFHIHFDTAGRGWVDAWMDGRKVVDHYMPACGTIYPAPYQAYTALRAGYYRDPAISTSGTVLHDDYLYAADGSTPDPTPSPSPSPAPSPSPSPDPTGTPTPPPTGAGTQLWGSDFETLSGVATPNNLGSYRTLYRAIQHDYDSTVKCSIETSTERARTGTRSLKMTVGASAPTGGVGRCLPTANFANARQGTDLWYGISVYLDNIDLSQVSGGRQFFFDGQGFRYTNTGANGPGAAMIGDRDTTGPFWRSGMNLSGTVGDFKAGSRTVCRLVNGQWLDMVQHVHWSAGSDGVYETWCDGVKVGPAYTGPTLMSSGLTAERRIGVYEGTGVTEDRTVFWDNDRIGTSFAAVDPSR
jgi:hypothetical protein